MQPSSSRAHASERSPTRKNKSQSQREYRSKEIDGFTELRDALLLVDPYDTPLGRDATRHQLLVTAAKKLRNLADENQKLILQLSTSPAAGLQEPEVTPAGMAIQYLENGTATSDITWSSQGWDLLSALEAVTPPQDYGTSRWTHSPPPFQSHGHQPYDLASGPTYQTPLAVDMWRF